MTIKRRLDRLSEAARRSAQQGPEIIFHLGIEPSDRRVSGAFAMFATRFDLPPMARPTWDENCDDETLEQFKERCRAHLEAHRP